MTTNYRITERHRNTNELVRVVAVLCDVTRGEAQAVVSESIARRGYHIRLERWIDHADIDACGWEYL